jgi:hypothetical protein
MKKKKKRSKKRNPYAALLSLRKYRQKRQTSKLAYQRAREKQKAAQIDA